MEKEEKIIHEFDESSNKKSPDSDKITSINMSSSKPPFTLFIILLVLGVGTGFLVSKVVGSPSSMMVSPNGKVTSVQKGQIYGSDDKKTFNNDATGTLKEGGIEGEGAYHLVRPGGESQNVYLTSSVIDLSQFVGKKVKVWGETNSSQKAGWLMDVGRLQLL